MRLLFFHKKIAYSIHKELYEVLWKTRKRKKMEERLLKIQSVETYVGISKSKIYELVKQKLFTQPISIGASSLYSYVEIQNWIKDKKNEGGRRNYPENTN